MNDQDELEMHEAMTEESSFAEATEDTPTTVGCPSLGIPRLPSGADGTEPGEKAKHGVLKNGVQMIRYAQGQLVELIGKRERGDHERQDGKTGKVIYKITISRASHSAEVSVDGRCRFTLFCKSLSLLEYACFGLLNSGISFNAKQQRHKKNRKLRARAAKRAESAN